MSAASPDSTRSIPPWRLASDALRTPQTPSEAFFASQGPFGRGWGEKRLLGHPGASNRRLAWGCRALERRCAVSARHLGNPVSRCRAV